MKKVISLLLAILMISCCFVACIKDTSTNDDNNATTANSTTASGITTETPEPQEPVDNSLKIYYDDRTTIAEIIFIQSSCL